MATKLADSGEKAMESTMSQKKQLLEHLSRKSQSACLGMQTWADKDVRQSETMEVQAKAIATLGRTIADLEAQVTAMARVMASQNLGNVVNDRAAALEDLKTDMEVQLKASKVEIMQAVQKEVAELQASGLQRSKKLETCEANTETVRAQCQEIAFQLGMTVEQGGLEKKFEQRFVHVEQDVVRETTKLREMCNTTISEFRKQLKTMQSEFEQDRVSRGAEFHGKQLELNNTVDTIKLRQGDLQSEVRNLIGKADDDMCAKIRNLKMSIVKEGEERSALGKQLMAQEGDTRHMLQQRILEAGREQDALNEQRTAALARFFPQLKIALEHERQARTDTVEEIRRAMAAEKLERDSDDQKLLKMVSDTMCALEHLHQNQMK